MREEDRKEEEKTEEKVAEMTQVEENKRFITPFPLTPSFPSFCLCYNVGTRPKESPSTYRSMRYRVLKSRFSGVLTGVDS